MQKNYDSAFCGSLPLNFINHIQPYGVLIVLERSSFNVVQVSQNIQQVVGIEVDEILNKPFAGFVAAHQFERLQELFGAGHTEKLPLAFTFTTDGEAKEFLGIVHAKAEVLLIELEQTGADAKDSTFLSAYQRLKHAMAAVNNADTIELVCEVTAHEFKKLAGFDKVMVYRFDDEWNGTVIAEAKKETMDSYMGLRFPASDVPKQARDLYQRNAYRQIPDRNFEPVKLTPVINPVTEAFTDLSYCNLRSVANVHLEYLKNMDVVASSSVRIMKNNRLWGLIACHHQSPKFLNYEVCSILELLANVISQKITSLENEDELNYTTYLKGVSSKLVAQLYTLNNMSKGLIDGENTVSDLLHTDNVVIMDGENYISKGDVPPENIVRRLAQWLEGMDIKNVFYTTNLSEVYEAGSQINETASGMIVLPINPEKRNYIIGFRPEVIHVVDWGGNPNEAIRFQEDKKNYHPRNSFGIWQETVKNTSLPWSKEEITVAESFRNVLVEFSLKKLSALS